MDRDGSGFLWDIARAGEDIAVFTAGLDAETFLENRLVYAAVERKFEIIGEALSQLAKFDLALAARIPDLPARDLIPQSVDPRVCHVGSVLRVWHRSVVAPVCHVRWSRPVALKALHSAGPRRLD